MRPTRETTTQANEKAGDTPGCTSTIPGEHETVGWIRIAVPWDIERFSNDACNGTFAEAVASSLSELPAPPPMPVSRCRSIDIDAFAVTTDVTETPNCPDHIAVAGTMAADPVPKVFPCGRNSRPTSPNTLSP
jgi:hypothetical protein